MNTIWIARWRVGGRLHSYTFRSVQSKGIAGIDFKLALFDAGYTIPTSYYLDEVAA
jgi:hypothetical protein